MVCNVIYSDSPAELYNTICAHKTDYLPPQMTFFITVLPILMHFFKLPSFKMSYIAFKVSMFCNIKPESAKET